MTAMPTLCKRSGMDLQQFLEYEARIARIADSLMKIIKADVLCGSGAYQDIETLLTGYTFREDIPERDFVITELKKSGVEFYDNARVYRY
jgi:hypothetical protein